RPERHRALVPVSRRPAAGRAGPAERGRLRRPARRPPAVLGAPAVAKKQQSLVVRARSDTISRASGGGRLLGRRGPGRGAAAPGGDRLGGPAHALQRPRGRALRARGAGDPAPRLGPPPPLL